MGILIQSNASATILNNVVANTSVGIRIGSGSQSTVVGTTAYSGNLANLIGGTQSFAIIIDPSEPLFVDLANGNFYPAAGSRIIDSSLDSLDDRPNMITVRSPLGLPPSPIIAPAGDLYGQLRIDDPSAAPPSGFGQYTFKDRGAIDRVDFEGPTCLLINPMDNDVAGLDRNPDPNDVLIAMIGNTVVRQFTIRLDDNGQGIDKNTVTADAVRVFQDGRELTAGLDYFFEYHSVSQEIRLESSAAAWAPKSTYTIVLTEAIHDLAGNSIQPNRGDGTTTFTITLAGFDFGDAPMFIDPAHAVSATRLPEGAAHLVVPGVRLGYAVDSESDAYVNSAATGDTDDGVVFLNGDFLPSRAAGETPEVKTIVVAASTAGFFDAWIDWNGDGVFDPAAEKIAFIDNADGALVEGENTLSFVIPAGLTNVFGMDVFETYARFRFTTTGLRADGSAMLPTGEAADGEVEDYRLMVVPPPGSVSGTVWNDLNADGLHDAGEPGLAGWTVFLDADDDGRLDPGEISAQTTGDGTYTLANVIPGVYTLREIVPTGWELVEPFAGFYTVTVVSDADSSGYDFFNRDLDPPTVVSIEIGDGSGAAANPTNADVVFFTVTFSEAVAGVDTGDFDLVVDGVSGAVIADVAPLSNHAFVVSVFTGSGDGTLQLNLIDDDSITDLSGNPLGGAGAGNSDFAGPVLTIDKTPPAVDSITLASANPSNAATVVFHVAFNEPVVGVDSNDFALAATGPTGASILSIVLTDGVYVVTVNTGSGDGTLQLNLVDDDSIVDAAGNPLGGPDAGNGDFAGPAYSIDKTVPQVVSIVRNDADPTNASTVGYTVTFTEAVTGVDAGDFAVSASGPVGYSILAVAGGGTTYVVSVKTGSGDGTLRLDLRDNNSILDAAGNRLGGAALYDGDFTGETYTIDRTHPTALNLSNNRVAESAPLGTIVGLLTSAGPHAGAYAYELVAGAGDADNAAFRVVGSYLVTNAAFDYAAKN